MGKYKRVLMGSTILLLILSPRFVVKAEEINAKRLEDAKHAAGITEETNTFAKWKELGYKVKHGASALFGCSLIWGSRGDGAEYKASFFGKSQVETI